MHRRAQFEVVVIRAGPAGLAAGCLAAKVGRRVAIPDHPPWRRRPDLTRRTGAFQAIFGAALAPPAPGVKCGGPAEPAPISGAGFGAFSCAGASRCLLCQQA
jgi:hypothetical protein